ncbi:major facilitator transporter [Enterobacter cloacae]|uniref:Major facilitator transporter n=1 Tax=Enterobacter cloacae TaxID=550 RepID=A0A377M330_ENTCL|nr:major facilitator transporter [Enterobacter cloacae]
MIPGGYLGLQANRTLWLLAFNHAGAVNHAGTRGAAASTDAPFMMIPVQILDGLAAGILGVVVPSFIVVLLRGSGHVNAGQSVVMLMQGVGASMSPR